MLRSTRNGRRRGEREPSAALDAERVKAVGLEAWIAEREERRWTGFAYVDTRSHPYEAPDD